MTRNELLAKLDLYEADYFDFPNKELLALRAVVESHSEWGNSQICLNCGKHYPCSTIQIIEKELS